MKYGIWGLGVVGKSVLRFLSNKGHELSVMDARIPTDEEQAFLDKNAISYISQSNSIQFFSSNDYIIPSPGIDVTPMAAVMNKLLPELDIFSAAWMKPLIAVTGSLGKTTTVAQLTAILQENGIVVATGGNIGTGMLDLLEQQDVADYALLELSSFQLEFSQAIRPDLAIITNLYPNHLDRHGSFEKYVEAKLQVIAHQRENQQALAPLELISDIQLLTDRPIHYFSMHDESALLQENTKSDLRRLLSLLRPTDTLYTWRKGQVMTLRGKSAETIATVPSDMPGYAQTWLTLIAACDLLGLLKNQEFSLPRAAIPPHRLEKLPSAAPYIFYNDSKSTVIEATLAAVDHLQPAPIHLLLGGISKGVDRLKEIGRLKNKVASILCFGGEAAHLYAACLQEGIPASEHRSLEAAFQEVLRTAQQGDTILLSPSGASYDLYKNYQERGDHFKRLIEKMGS